MTTAITKEIIHNLIKSDFNWLGNVYIKLSNHSRFATLPMFSQLKS